MAEDLIVKIIMGKDWAQGLESQEAWDEWMIEIGQNTETTVNRVILS